MGATIQNLHIPGRSNFPAEGATILAGDVGGTKTNLAIYHAATAGLATLAEQRYPSDQFSSIIDILKEFLAANHQHPIHRICLGVAGPVLNGRVELTNIGWELDVADIRQQLHLEQVALINDLEATAYGLAALQPDDFITLHPGRENSNGNMAIIAPGTGLGEAGLYWNGRNHFPFPTEGGHTGFAPRTDADIALLRVLQQKYGMVSWERVVSGPAIFDIYEFLRDQLSYEEPEWLNKALLHHDDDPAVISTAALNKAAPICVETMDFFVRYLAYESANLVLKLKATGGLFLGGGIPPKIAPLLQQESFYRHYLDSDRMQHLLETVPIRIIQNDKTALIGAGWYAAYGDW